MLWEAKANVSDSYTTMKTPSTYEIDGEDLDKNSYRSITTGDVNRPIILGKKWQKFNMGFNYTTEEEIEPMLTMINNYPLFVRLKSPMYGSNGTVEMRGYVSKWKVKMIRNKDNQPEWELSFNFVQGKKVQGQ